MSDFAAKQNNFWEKMDDPLFWESIKPSKYIRTPYSTIHHCNKIGYVYILDHVIEILWDYVKQCVFIQDGNNWYHLRHTVIFNLTVRQVIKGIVSNEQMETIWSDNGQDVLDMMVDKAPLFKVRVFDLDDVDMCERL
jgi:hypothetical protein